MGRPHWDEEVVPDPDRNRHRAWTPTSL